MTPPTNTQLITVRKTDKDMMKTINELLQVNKAACRVVVVQFKGFGVWV